MTTNSRQRKWQLDKKLLGLCVCCGLPKDGTSANYCPRCAKRYRDNIRAKRGCQPWKPGGPGRMPLEWQVARDTFRDGAGI